MAKQDSNRNQAGKPARASYQREVQLKAFLRQAVAIIAAERGLNTQSRLKLESLAKHQKLPDDLFAEAIRQLQGDEASISKLNRYEQEFVKYLAGEFKKVRSGIISLRMEQNAIELADKKYQIPPIRAEWLIDQQAKLASIGRLSRGEAEEYAAQFIAERIGDRHALEPELRHEIYERGHKLGLTRDRVDAEISRLLDINRFGDQPRSRKKWWIVGLLLLSLVSLGVGGFATGWLPVSIRQPKEIPSEPPPPLEIPISERPAPGWMAESTKELILRVARTETRSPDLVSNLLAEDPARRRSGFGQLTSLICQKSWTQRKQVEELICQLYFEEPEPSVAFELIETTCQFVRIPDDLLPVSIEVLERQYRANRLLGLIYYFVPTNSETDFSDGPTDEAGRKQELAKRINSVTGIDPVNLLFPEYIMQSERGISVDQWNYLIQNNWESPSRAALLVQPLCDLTRTRLAPNSLNKFCFRLLQSILESDDRQWLQLQRPIRETVSSADEVELIEWIELFETSTSMAFREFVGPQLIQKANIESPSTRLADVSMALEKFVSSYRNRILQPFLARNERLENMTVDLLENLAANDLYTPDQIAQLAFMTNANLAFCQQIRQNEIGTDDDFLRLDEMLARPKIRLRELVSLPGKSTNRTAGADPTASDINRKNNALGKIRNLSTESSRSRINALVDLEKIAPRFDDLAYGEAEILARYFLADLADEETLNIQRIISAFDEWPNLGLALADQISQRNTSLDRALTAARLLFNTEFEVPLRDENWAGKLQMQMIKAVADRVEIRLEQDPANTQSDWNRLELFLADVYRERFDLIVDETVDSELIGPLVRPSEILFAIIEHQLPRQLGTPEYIRRIRRGKNLVRLGSYNEMEKTIVANQLLFELLNLVEGEIPAHQAAALDHLSERFESKFDSRTGLVDQLFVVNYALLQVAALKRQLLADRIIQEK